MTTRLASKGLGQQNSSIRGSRTAKSPWLVAHPSGVDRRERPAQPGMKSPKGDGSEAPVQEPGLETSRQATLHFLHPKSAYHARARHLCSAKINSWPVVPSRIAKVASVPEADARDDHEAEKPTDFWTLPVVSTLPLPKNACLSSIPVTAKIWSLRLAIEDRFGIPPNVYHLYMNECGTKLDMSFKDMTVGDVVENGCVLAIIPHCNWKNLATWAMTGTYNDQKSLMAELMTTGGGEDWIQQRVTTAVHIVSYHGHYFILFELFKAYEKYVLLNTRAAVEDFPKRISAVGRSPLHCAARGGHWKCLCLLLEKGSDIRLLDGNGRDAGKLAELYGHTLCQNTLNYCAKNIIRRAKSKPKRNTHPLMPKPFAPSKPATSFSRQVSKSSTPEFDIDEDIAKAATESFDMHIRKERALFAKKLPKIKAPKPKPGKTEEKGEQPPSPAKTTKGSRSNQLLPPAIRKVAEKGHPRKKVDKKKVKGLPLATAKERDPLPGTVLAEPDTYRLDWCRYKNKKSTQDGILFPVGIDLLKCGRNGPILDPPDSVASTPRRKPLRRHTKSKPAGLSAARPPVAMQKSNFSSTSASLRSSISQLDDSSLTAMRTTTSFPAIARRAIPVVSGSLPLPSPLPARLDAGGNSRRTRRATRSKRQAAPPEPSPRSTSDTTSNSHESFVWREMSEKVDMLDWRGKMQALEEKFTGIDAYLPASSSARKHKEKEHVKTEDQSSNP